MPIHALHNRTLAGEATVQGPALFLPLESTIRFLPAQAGSGIIFLRDDLKGRPEIPALIDRVVSDGRHTVVQHADDKSVNVQTIEHVMSAFAGLGITDCVVAMSCAEPPICDGSSLSFVQAMVRAGLQEPDRSEPIKPIVVTEPIRIEDGLASIEAYPAPKPMLELVYDLDYGSSAPIPVQESRFVFEGESGSSEYVSMIAPARTFCLVEEAQAMRRLGYFKHFEPRDLLVIGDDGPIDNAYLFANEPARHKLLDMIGDLSLAGRPILGRIVGCRSGHALNHRMARALADLKPA